MHKSCSLGFFCLVLSLGHDFAEHRFNCTITVALFFTCSIQETSRAGLSFNKPLAECLDAAAKQVFPETPKDQLKILDAGAGTGLTGVELYKLGYTNIEALDISQEMLNVAEKKGVYKRFVCTPLTEQRIAEFETGEFDALISAGVLVKAHVRPAAFVEMIRMVKTGESCLSSFCFRGERERESVAGVLL